jgi:hypothetical protein
VPANVLFDGVLNLFVAILFARNADDPRIEAARDLLGQCLAAESCDQKGSWEIVMFACCHFLSSLKAVVTLRAAAA